MMDWISVEDRLPEETGEYLVNVHMETEDDATDTVIAAWYNTDVPLLFEREVGWILLNEYYDLSSRLCGNITHWAPWPSPPKEDV